MKLKESMKNHKKTKRKYSNSEIQTMSWKNPWRETLLKEIN